MKLNKIILALLILPLFFACDVDGKKTTDNMVSVTFNSDGGTTVASVVIQKGKSMGSKYPADPTRVDSIFEGWYEGATLYTKDTVINNNVTLKAKWLPLVPILITFNPDNGTNEFTKEIFAGTSLGVNMPEDPVKADHVFGGWWNGSTRYYDNTKINSAITLTAKWLVTFSVNFNSDGGSPGNLNLSNVLEGSILGLLFEKNPSKNGFVFGGWFADTDISYTKEYKRTDPITVSINLKARWIASYTVTFDSDGGTQVSAIAVPQNTAMSASFPAAPEKIGYAFKGWFNGATQYTSATIINSNITLKASWEASITPVTTWQGFTLPPRTKGELHPVYQGKNDVLKISPSSEPSSEPSSGYDWNVMSQSLAAYIGREIKIEMSMNVWLDTISNENANTGRIAFQVNDNAVTPPATSSWPIIVDQSEVAITTGHWVNITGFKNVKPRGNGNNEGNQLYLSSERLGKGTVAYIADFSMAITEVVAAPAPGTVYLTIGSKIDLKNHLTDKSKTISSWASGNSALVSVDSNGNASALSFGSNGGATAFITSPASANVKITATATDSSTQELTVIATTAAQVSNIELDSLKNTFSTSFSMIGNIATSNDASANGSAITNQVLTHHFNTLTSENDMKPDSYGNTPGSLTWTRADRFVNAARASGFKIIGHTLLWHQQNPSWITNMASADRETALTAMKKFITDVMTRYAGKIHTWDILNEVFPDGGYTSDWKTSMRQENPWFKAIGSDFVYEAYLTARLADPDAKLYYNDYNTDMSSKATMIHNMVRDVNKRYKEEYINSTRPLIEGIGMQEHHNLGVSTASIEATINLFKKLDGIKISVSELDVIAYSSYSGLTNAGGAGANKYNSAKVTNTELISQATKYNEYMKLYIKHKDIIERVSLWGVKDDQSWRSAGLPLLFDPYGKAKPAYYSFIDALK